MDFWSPTNCAPLLLILIVLRGTFGGDLNLTGAFLKELDFNALAPDRRFFSSILSGDLISNYFLMCGTRLSFIDLPLLRFCCTDFLIFLILTSSYGGDLLT